MFLKCAHTGLLANSHALRAKAHYFNRLLGLSAFTFLGENPQEDLNGPIFWLVGYNMGYNGSDGAFLTSPVANSRTTLFSIKAQPEEMCCGA